MVGYHQDITDRKTVESEKVSVDEMLDAAIENVPGGFLLVDQDGFIRRFNRKFFDLYPKQQFFINEGVPFARFLQYGVDMNVYLEAQVNPEGWLERFTAGDIVAFVGGGGKTSTMLKLAGELAERGLRVLSTTTTRIARRGYMLAIDKDVIEVL